MDVYLVIMYFTSTFEKQMIIKVFLQFFMYVCPYDVTNAAMKEKLFT
jgi:hypothetical protein